MDRKRNDEATSTLNVNFRADRDLVHRFREIVGKEERTVSAALRLYMTRTVEQAEEKAAA